MCPTLAAFCTIETPAPSLCGTMANSACYCTDHQVLRVAQSTCIHLVSGHLASVVLTSSGMARVPTSFRMCLMSWYLLETLTCPKALYDRSLPSSLPFPEPGPGRV